MEALGTLMNKINVLIKEIPTELHSPVQKVRIQVKGAGCESGGRHSPEHDHATTLILTAKIKNSEK